MEKLIAIIRKNWGYLIGGVLGGVGGYLYWYYIGCSTGTCPITASPVMTVLWSTLMGALLLSAVTSKKDEKK